MICNENKAESIEIKVIVGKEIINRTIISITSRKLILNKIDDIGIKIIFGITRDINITNILIEILFLQNILKIVALINYHQENLQKQNFLKLKLKKKLLSSIKLVYIWLKGLKCLVQLQKQKVKFDVKKKVQ